MFLSIFILILLKKKKKNTTTYPATVSFICLTLEMMVALEMMRFLPFAEIDKRLLTFKTLCRVEERNWTGALRRDFS